MLINSSTLQPSIARLASADGPARALADPLREKRRVICLVDDLAPHICIRLPGLANGPDAMRVSVLSIGAATAPIVSKSVGRDRPQLCAKKSGPYGKRHAQWAA